MIEETSSDTQDETLNASDLQTETVTTPESDETLETTATTNQTSTSVEELQAQIKRLDAANKKSNKEAMNHRLANAELKKLNAELAKFREQIETEKLSETERQAAEKKRLEKQIAELQTERDKALTEKRDLTISQTVFSQASKLNIVDPEVALMFVKPDLEFDESGNPTNVEDLLKDLVKEKPYLVVQQQGRPAPTSGGPTNPPRSQTGGKELSWDYIGKLNNAEYAARRDEIQRWMNDPKNRK